MAVLPTATASTTCQAGARIWPRSSPSSPLMPSSSRACRSRAPEAVGVGVRDAAHDVLAGRHLRVDGGSLGHRLAGFEVDEVGRQFRGADVDGRAERHRALGKQGDDLAAALARPAAVYRHPCRPVLGAQGHGGSGQHGEAGPRRRLAGRGDRLPQTGRVAAQIIQPRRPDLDVKRYDRGVERWHARGAALELKALGGS